jgi:hypothetical protein
LEKILENEIRDDANEFNMFLKYFDYHGQYFQFRKSADETNILIDKLQATIQVINYLILFF